MDDRHFSQPAAAGGVPGQGGQARDADGALGPPSRPEAHLPGGAGVRHATPAGGAHTQVAARARGGSGQLRAALLPWQVRRRARFNPSTRRHHALLREGRVRRGRTGGARAPHLVPQRRQLEAPLQARRWGGAHKLRVLRGDVGKGREDARRNDGRPERPGVQGVLRPRHQAVGHAAAAAARDRVQRARRSLRLSRHRPTDGLALPSVAARVLLPGQGAVGKGSPAALRLLEVAASALPQANANRYLRQG
mmetsp:Transcript_38126/g.65369  ORF Transcript_38126/g.65369 Transcript_38126/m.65369 type:complete len:250 (-) Transcript_38126:1028-1777(-)